MLSVHSLDLEMFRLLLLVVVLVASADGAPNCSTIYSRCVQTVQMSLASAVPGDNLNPSTNSITPPSFLAIPASPFAVIQSNDMSAIQTYATHTAMGNYDYCMSMKVCPNHRHPSDYTCPICAAT